MQPPSISRPSPSSASRSTEKARRRGDDIAVAGCEANRSEGLAHPSGRQETAPPHGPQKVHDRTDAPDLARRETRRAKSGLQTIIPAGSAPPPPRRTRRTTDAARTAAISARDGTGHR